MTARTTARRAPAAETPPEPEPEPAEGEPTPEPEPAEQPEEGGEGATDSVAGKIENAQRKYRRDLERILGPLDGALDCPLCHTFGFVDEAEALQVRDDLERCSRCHGRGLMYTGSIAPGHETLPCPDCGGTGYKQRIEPAPANVVPIAPPAAAPVAQQVHGWFDPVTQQFHPYGEQAPS